jgi:hypothetical protein
LKLDLTLDFGNSGERGDCRNATTLNRFGREAHLWPSLKTLIVSVKITHSQLEKDKDISLILSLLSEKCIPENTRHYTELYER